jgi:hypothetical protein
MKDTDIIFRLRNRFISKYNQPPNLLIINDPEHPVLTLVRLWDMRIILDDSAVEPFTVALEL